MGTQAKLHTLAFLEGSAADLFSQSLQITSLSYKNRLSLFAYYLFDVGGGGVFFFGLKSSNLKADFVLVLCSVMGFRNMNSSSDPYILKIVI